MPKIDMIKQVLKTLREIVKIGLLITGAMTLIDSLASFLNDEFLTAYYLLGLSWFAFWMAKTD